MGKQHQPDALELIDLVTAKVAELREASREANAAAKNLRDASREAAGYFDAYTKEKALEIARAAMTAIRKVLTERGEEEMSSYRAAIEEVHEDMLDQMNKAIATYYAAFMGLPEGKEYTLADLTIRAKKAMARKAEFFDEQRRG